MSTVPTAAETAAIFDAQVAPLLQQAARIMREHHIPGIFVCQLRTAQGYEFDTVIIDGTEEVDARLAAVANFVRLLHKLDPEQIKDEVL